jgi:hypothetical protein
MTGGRDERNEPDGRSSEVGRRRRPRWMSFFTILMFLMGANLFVHSLDSLYRIGTGTAKRLDLDDVRDAQQAAVLRSQLVLDNELFRYKPKVMAVQTLGGLILGLAYLFAVAAVVSRDARGRRACLLAGWAGLVVSAGNAAFVLLWVRKALPWVIPKVVEALAQDAVRTGRPIPTVDVVAEQSSYFLIFGPAAVYGLGMVLSLVMLAYFAGDRMRRFYQHSGQYHG